MYNVKSVKIKKTHIFKGTCLEIILFFSGTYELQVPENRKVNEKIGTLKLEDRDQIQNKEPSFILPSDISKLFGVELSPTKDANIMLRKVGGRC